MRIVRAPSVFPSDKGTTEKFANSTRNWTDNLVYFQRNHNSNVCTIIIHLQKLLQMNL